MARSSSPAIGCSTLRLRLEASDPQPGTLDIELVAPHLDGLADPQAVPVDHEQKGVVANAVAPFFAASSGDRSPDRSKSPWRAREHRWLMPHSLRRK